MSSSVKTLLFMIVLIIAWIAISQFSGTVISRKAPAQSASAPAAKPTGGG